MQIEAETGKCFTYREMFEKSFKIAAFLNKIGCSENSVIGTACENQVDFLCLLLAVWHIGAICNCVHPRQSEGKFAHPIYFFIYIAENTLPFQSECYATMDLLILPYS